MQAIRNIIFLSLLFMLFGCKEKDTLFKNPSAEDTGLTFVNTLTESDDFNIIDYLYFYNGGGLAIGDINGDTLPDIFISGNQVKNKLYLNKGNLQFEDISDKAGITGNSTWNTGAVMGDVNGDGLLDIYVCAVVGINGFDGYNELYINNGDATFTESAAKYGLDLDTYSSNAAFLDYDLDGDLDIYILNHAVHTQESYGKASLRFKRNYETGDRLMRNDGGKFTDVSEEAGILGGINSYGLGIAIADFNQDGWPDIYVGNDFHEDDYYYLNTGEGSFRESLKDYFGHTSRFSMGNDVADINADGWPDMISLDMLPEDEKVLKSSEGDDNIQTQKLRIDRFGYHYQFTRNMLYVNQKGYDYQETALLSGIAATDWSWSALFADFDQDSTQDLFISNGIPKRPNDLDYVRFISSKQIQNKISNTKLIDQKALDLMPKGNTHNYIFKGKGQLAFEDLSGTWTQKDTLVSGATALADLDNDGDLDIVTNNINTTPQVYQNTTDASANYLKIRFEYKKGNTLGIGTKVFAYHKGQLQYKELYTVRGFQASSEPILHFGVGNAPSIDSLKVIWPDRTSQILTNVTTNQTLTISPKGNTPFNYNTLQPKSQSLFKKVVDNLGIDFTHTEDRYIDFNRQKLIPYQVSDRGPAVAIGDINGDQRDDIYFGSSKFQESKIYLADSIGFTAASFPIITKETVTEDVVATLQDFDQDGRADLLIGTGGTDFDNKAKPLKDLYYTAKDTTFVQQQLPESFQNASVLAVHDYDNDGDLDVFVGNQAVTNDFGRPSESLLLRNDKGTFSIDDTTSFNDIGMLTDAVWSDFNADGTKDLILIGEWMAPQFYANTNGSLQKVLVTDASMHGLWQAIEPFDMDADGDIDYILGNWGENSKFSASPEAPMYAYLDDFDSNGQSETIIATQKNGAYYPLLGLNELGSQMTNLFKKYTSYKDFGGQTVDAIFGKKALSQSTQLRVETLQSGYLKNENGRFRFVPFGESLQIAPIMAFETYDFDGDGQKEVLAAGNYFGVKPFHGRLDSFSGALLKSDGSSTLGHHLGLDLAQKSVRHLSILSVDTKTYLLVTFNNEKAHVYQLQK
ncbi:VCBS repeat-containing protein [uncultured Dokdonia sp.]|uniref:VCBS repeat-containing protein n=1 Tax=uncultured Dokdonia sp. TaxID=575653 RepID=UPI00261805B2|nr:VCBS repeat-containing protein [uncultured Dokdonia sp.]